MCVIPHVCSLAAFARTCTRPALMFSSNRASLIRRMRVVEVEGGKLNGCAEPLGFTTEWRFYWPKLWRGETVWPLMLSIGC